ncbi:MAG: hypothetical protein M0P13_01130 [Fibrobacteraceae bacterium]|nr:hypothetical protein [Fibrobacteraceae bacterium]
MENQLKARMDIRGFLRFTKDLVAQFKLKTNTYADLMIDKVGGRIAIVPSNKLKATSFRILPSNDTSLLYLKGAMNTVGLKVVSGDVILTKEGNKIIFQSQKKSSKKTGNWEPFACRNSAGLPMISIDPRGTLILDKRCITALNTKKNDTMTPTYDAKKKTFNLTFGKKGLVNVRTIESHASLSLMGTLSSFGVKLPTEHFRTSADISGTVLTFKLG